MNIFQKLLLERNKQHLQEKELSNGMVYFSKHTDFHYIFFFNQSMVHEFL
jgi:hypothetical protein